MWPNIIIKDQNYHPQPQKGSGAAQMGQNMTKNGTKNSLKQPKTTKPAFGSFHQCINPTHHNVCFHIVFECFLQSQNPAGFSFSYLQPTFQQNPHLRGGIPHNNEFSEKSAQLLLSV